MIKKERKIKKSIYVSNDIGDNIKKYCAKNNMTQNQVVNRALEKFFSVQSYNDNLTLLTEIVESRIDKILKPKMERLISLEAKSSKASFSSMFLLAQVLSYIFNENDETEFMKECLAKANELGYKAVKNYSLKDDINKMIPNDLNFKNTI